MGDFDTPGRADGRPAGRGWSRVAVAVALVLLALCLVWCALVLLLVGGVD